MLKRFLLPILALSLAACLNDGTLDVETVPSIETTSDTIDQSGTNGAGTNGAEANNGTTGSTETNGMTSGQTNNGSVGGTNNGTGSLPACDAGQERCMGECIDVTMNDANCGTCGMACDSGRICVESECACEVGDFCGGECVDTTANQQHCGRCDNPCAGGQVCEAGACVTLGEVDGVLAATNQWRASGADCGVYGQFGPTNPLSGDTDLHEAAQAHAQDMADNDFFSHTGSDGSNFVERINRTAFTGQPIGENIAAGQRSATQVVDGWVDSDGHCRNLMNPQATKIGIGYTTGGPYGTLWVQVFGR